MKKLIEESDKKMPEMPSDCTVVRAPNGEFNYVLYTRCLIEMGTFRRIHVTTESNTEPKFDEAAWHKSMRKWFDDTSFIN